MGIFGGLFRAFTGKPPKIPPGAVVRLESVPVAGLVVGSLEQRPYWVMLDADRQEAGDRHYLARQTFTDLGYAEAWCAWVQGQGTVPMPPYPEGAV